MWLLFKLTWRQSGFFQTCCFSNFRHWIKYNFSINGTILLSIPYRISEHDDGKAIVSKVSGLADSLKDGKLKPLKDEAVFVVFSGDLGVSVIVFSTCAIICIGTLIARRVVLGCELGGPVMAKKLTFAFLVFLWVTYIAISSVVALQKAPSMTCPS